jgi:hypothetical protein
MHNYCTPHIIKENLGTYAYLKCSVYDKLLQPRYSFRITLYVKRNGRLSLTQLR